MNKNSPVSSLAREDDLAVDSTTMLNETFSRLHNNICIVIAGKDDVIKMVLSALISGGHVLLEDIPGVGKTTLAKSIARSISASYSRIQFTPDLLPSDITGSTIYSPKEERFFWSPGPIFANIVLADEINRTSPRTQAAMLEAMEEHQVTVDRKAHPVPDPFFVIATQNPHELHGTFPLPDGQKDRFLISLSMGLPKRDFEQTLVRRQLQVHPLENLEPVIDANDIIELRQAARRVQVAENVLGYAIDIVEATRNSDEILIGASPRASIALIHMSQALAFVDKRSFVIPDDIQQAAVPVLAHRLLLRSGHAAKVTEAASVIEEIVASRRVPV